MARVLVIDDESLILNFLRDILIRLGYEVKIAHDGKEGIDVFNTDHELDLVITDIRMPRMDGNAVARHIRNSDRPDMPIIAISGFAHEAESELFRVS
jgi:CheY-like chemotaxis protein